MDSADNHGQLQCYHDLEAFFWGTPTPDRAKFLNALYAVMPEHRWVWRVHEFHNQHGQKFTPLQLATYNGTHGYASYDSRIYVAVIQCARNLCRHGYECSLKAGFAQVCLYIIIFHTP